MRVIVIEQNKNHNGNVTKEWKEVYGIHENKIAKKHLEQIIQDLDDNDVNNDIVDAINLCDGFYQFDTGDINYRIDIVSL